nr:hypothetical protein [Tanacetum cinerariifolium]
MGGSSSQPRTDPSRSPINAFPIEELYTPEFLESLQENTAYRQEPNPYEAAGKRVVTSPTKKKKATRNRQKRAIQTNDAPRQTAWTTDKEIELAKGWCAIFENSQHGNARKKDDFWCEVLAYIGSKTKQKDRQTYDMVVEKWKTCARLRDKARAAAKNKTSKASGSSTMNDDALARFCGVYGTVMRMAQESGAGDEDYVQKAMLHYEHETRVPFRYRHCWDVLKDSPKFQEIAFPNFNQRDKVRAAAKNKGSKASGSSTMNDDALARLMVNEMTSDKV